MRTKYDCPASFGCCCSIIFFRNLWNSSKKKCSNGTAFNRVNFDTTLLNKVGFKYYNQTTKRWNYSHGIDKADKLDSITIIQYESNLNQLIATHKLLIQILNKKGDELKTKLIIQL